MSQQIAVFRADLHQVIQANIALQERLQGAEQARHAEDEYPRGLPLWRFVAGIVRPLCQSWT
jgi:hypothetical protein